MTVSHIYANEMKIDGSSLKGTKKNKDILIRKLSETLFSSYCVELGIE